jgi:hypothetical protein
MGKMKGGNMPKIKLTEDGNAVIEDGKLVMVDDDGKDFSFDVEGAHTTISELRNEAGTWRKKLRAAESSLEKFGDIDPDAAAKALQDVQAMSDDHKTAMENLRKEMSSAYDEKIQDRDGTIENLQGQIFKFQVSDKFNSSEVAKSLIYDPSDAAIIFGQNFEIENGNVVGKLNGNIIYSREKPGEPAGFDEALQAMIDARPNKDSILKSNVKPGAGTPPGSGVPGDDGAGNSAVDNISQGLREKGWA